MVRILFSLFFVLHGLVHLLYFGQSARYFELQAGMLWPDGSWAFTNLFGNPAARVIASICLILVAVGFVAGGSGLFLKQPWWRLVVVCAAVFSSVIYFLFWDGSLRSLDDKGGVGVLINVATLAALLVFQWPVFDF